VYWKETMLRGVRLGGIPLAAVVLPASIVLGIMLLPSCREGSPGEEGKAGSMMEDRGLQFRQIGTIRSPYTPETGAPRQGRHAPEAESRIVVDPRYEAALQDLESFSHVIVLYAFDRSAGWSPLVETPWEERPHGVFATRSPNRPSPIGMTVVSLLRREGAVLHVAGLDAFDGTPVLDLKPYLPGVDRIEDATEGWLQGLDRRPGSASE
jgi:tRNA-Thr(GGU) m(6)t(6)A37 methyltransferase TsaA